MRRVSLNSNLVKAFINTGFRGCHPVHFNSQFIAIKNPHNNRIDLFHRQIKSNCNLILRLIIIIICLCGFLSQASHLTINYFNYETIVKVKYETVSESILPGITICFPFFAILDQLKIKYPQFEYYANLSLNKLKEFRKGSFNGRKKLEPIIIDGNEVDPSSIYNYFQNQAFNQNTILEMFDMSIPFQFDLKGNLFKTLNGIILTRDENLTKISNNSMESFMVDDNGIYRKCFTLYRNLDMFANNINFQNIEITVNMNGNWFEKEFLKSKHFLFLLHKPNFTPVPSEGNFIRLLPNKEYVVLFSRIKKHLLKPPYQTNCFQYQTFPLNQDHCIVDCIDKIAVKECGECAPRFNLQIKQFVFSNTTKLCNVTHSQCGRPQWYKEAQINCEIRCQPDCYTEFYEFYETSDNQLKDYEIHAVNRTIIRLIHKTIPDVEIKHFPEFTWSSYVANMGGLAGMWLGFSMISAYKWIVIVVKRFNAKYKRKLTSKISNSTEIMKNVKEPITPIEINHSASKTINSSKLHSSFFNKSFG